jgi:hypothetical protein
MERQYVPPKRLITSSGLRVFLFSEDRTHNNNRRKNLKSYMKLKYLQKPCALLTSEKCLCKCNFLPKKVVIFNKERKKN